MKKVILLEDRIKRQKNLLKDIEIDLNSDSYSDIFDNINGVEFTELTDEFASFLENRITQYNVIIAHESALKSKGLIDILKESCQNNGVKLVLFSGGINITSYSNVKYELLYLNSRSFYSNNLKMFLDNAKKTGEFNLLELAYGANWKINLFFNYIEKDANFIPELVDGKMLYKEFVTDTKISTIKEYIDFKEPDVINGWIEPTALKNFSSELKNNILTKVYDVL